MENSLKSNARSFRRFQYAKRKKRCIVKKYWGLSRSEWEVGQLGVAANTPQPHSCIFCCNERKIHGPTRAEKISAISMKEQLLEYYGGLNE